MLTDSVMGTWTYAYDDFNRLTSASATGESATGAQDKGLLLTWQYDRYGNRWSQTAGTIPGYNPPGGNVSAVQPQLSFSGNNNHVDGWSYDDDGNLLNDGRNSYASTSTGA
jgi:YD repeat-containing protein